MTEVDITIYIYIGTSQGKTENHLHNKVISMTVYLPTLTTCASAQKFVQYTRITC